MNNIIKEQNIPVHAGCLCTPNYLIKTILNLDFLSPFMMMRINIKDICSIIKNNFELYVKSSMYIRDKPGEIIHTEYSSIVWNHLDTLSPSGYEKLLLQVNNLKMVLNSTTSKTIIYICFTGYQINNDNIDIDCLELLNMSNEYFPTHKFKIFLFTDCTNVGDKILQLHNENILYLPTTYNLCFWKLSEEERSLAIKEVELLYKSNL